MPVPSRRISAFSALLALAVVASLMAVAPAGASSDRASTTPSIHPRVARALNELSASDAYGAFVHFRAGSSADQTRLLTSMGLQVTATFPSVDVLYAVGTVGRFRSLTHEPAISYLEPDRKLQRFGDSGPWATRARVAQQNVSGGPFLDATGAVLDGKGIGVAVVDSGINALHPDLANRVVKNFKIVCSTPFLINTNTGMCAGPIVTMEARHTDITGGHGTHVAGIVAGDGTASQGTVKGVAPGASLYGYGTGEAIFILTAAEAFQHILTNYETFTPRIKVVNNSWGDGGGSAYNANSVLSKLTKQLIAKGVTVVYAAGNDGGSGTADELSSTAKDPTPGVITVANYDDADSGTRGGSLNSTSSRGKRGEPANYPDMSAPGTNINASCIQAIQPVCNAGRISPEWQPYYSDLSGTSMAAPHVAGVAAMLYQARPDLTPAQVEDVLQDTALKFTFGAPYEPDPQNPQSTTSFDKGAGLVDVPTSLRALGLSGSGVSASSVEIVAGDGGDFPGPGAADIASLSASNEATGIRYVLTVRDVDDVGPGGVVSLRVTQNVDGKAFTTSLGLTRTGATVPAQDPVRNSAPASEVTVDVASNSVSFLVPYPALGDPPANSPAHNAFASSFIQGVVDVAPGGPGADVLVRPRHGAPYTIKPVAPADPDPTPTETATPTPTPTTEPSPTETTPPGGGGSAPRGTYPVAPNDPYFPDISDPLAPQQWAPQKTQAPLAWQEPQATGYNVKVAVLDSGVDLQHADLQCPGKLDVVAGSDVVKDGEGPDDIDGHGTHVAGIIGACTDNGTGIAGVAPDSTIMPFQIFSADGGAIEDMVTAIRGAADSGAHVINMSLSVGIGGAPGTGAIGWLPGLLPEVDEAIEYANSKGVVVVAAAGNGSLPLCEYPAIAEDVICVGATDNRDLKTWYSGFPNKPDLGPAVVAPGGNEVLFCNVNSESIFSLYPEELDGCNEGAKGYRSLNGTSMASPHVAGVAALVYDRLNAERSPENRETVVNAIVDSAADLGTPGYDPVFGYGRVDALAAVRAVEAVTPTPTAAATTLDFTGATATGAQHSDEAVIAARLTETENGEPVDGQELVFELAGTGGSRTWTATTDATGVAGGSVTIEDMPGSYTLNVRFAGQDDAYLASADVAGFTVDKDDSTTALTVLGDRNNRRLSSTTTDADSSTGLAGVVVTFYADGVELASSTTSSDGTATIDVAKKFTKQGTNYEVIFGGSDTYLGSSAQQRI